MAWLSSPLIIRLFPYLDYHESVILQKTSLKVLILIIKSTYQGWYHDLGHRFQECVQLVVMSQESLWVTESLKSTTFRNTDLFKSLYENTTQSDCPRQIWNLRFALLQKSHLIRESRSNTRESSLKGLMLECIGWVKKWILRHGFTSITMNEWGGVRDPKVRKEDNQNGVVVINFTYVHLSILPMVVDHLVGRSCAARLVSVFTRE